MDGKEITLISAMYNMEKYVGECLQSLAEQTYSEFELILINDASTDDTLQICRQFQKDHPEMSIKILINEKNLGVSGSLERGVLEAATPWIYILDSDDFLHPQLLEVGMKYLHSDACADVDILRTQTVMNSTRSLHEYEWKKITELPEIKLSKEGDNLYDRWQIMDGLSLGKNFIRRQLFNTVDWQEYKRKWPRRFFMDGLFSVTLAHSARRVGLIKGNLYIYRIRKNSTGRGLSRYDHLRDWVATDVELIKNLREWNEIQCADECLTGLMQQIMRLYYYMRQNHIADKDECAFMDEQYESCYRRSREIKQKYPLIHRISYYLFHVNKNVWCSTAGNLYFSGRNRTSMKTKFT